MNTEMPGDARHYFLFELGPGFRRDERVVG